MSAFTFGCLTDASIIWKISGMSIALGVYSTVLTLLRLRKELKQLLHEHS